MIVLILLSLVIALWIASGVVLAFLATKATNIKHALLPLLHNRRDNIPLLINLMKPYVIKAEEVFAKTVIFHQRLLFQDDFRLEHELSQQLLFIFSVAEHHPTLLQDRLFIQAKQAILDIETKIHEVFIHYNASVGEFSRWKKITTFVLFPGAFFPFSFTPVDL